MATIKITAKRQATLPSELCLEMGIKPGDELIVEKKIVDGRRVWTLAPKTLTHDWFGSLQGYARHKSHDMKDIRKSLGKGLGGEKSP